MLEPIQVKDLKDAVEAILRSEEHKSQIAEQILAQYADVKAKGYDVVAVKKIVSDIRKDLKKVLQQEEIIDIYRNALDLTGGM